MQSNAIGVNLCSHVLGKFTHTHSIIQTDMHIHTDDTHAHRPRQTQIDTDRQSSKQTETDGHRQTRTGTDRQMLSNHLPLYETGL